METAMSIIDQALKANERYAKTYNPKWGEGPPKPKIVVVTCMDPRLSGLPGILGLKQADIDVIRTGGGPNVTEDVLAELIVSTRVLGSKEIMLLNHTGCGFTTFTDAELNAKFSKLTGDEHPPRCTSLLSRTRSNRQRTRSRWSGHIPGFRKKFPCGASFSMSIRAVCER
jgi:carbonic anhydrase